MQRRFRLIVRNLHYFVIMDNSYLDLITNRIVVQVDKRLLFIIGD